MKESKQDRKKNKRIESHDEISALLHYFMKHINSDAVILYKYIDADDLEVIELLELLSISPITKYISDAKVKGYKIKELINQYNDGGIDFNDEASGTAKALNELKKSIKVLRFCDFVEKEGSSRWDFDYANRPRKYIVITDEKLLKNIPLSNDIQPEGLNKHNIAAWNNQIPDEGVTALFCRSKGNKDNFIYKNSNSSKKKDGKKAKPNEPDVVPYLVFSRDELNNQRSHTKTTKGPRIFDNFHSHHAAFVLLNEANKNESIGCLRFEFYDKGELFENDAINEKLKDIADVNMINMVVGVAQKVFSTLKDKSYEKQYKCLHPLLNQIKDVGVIIRKKRKKECDRFIEKNNISDIDFEIIKKEILLSEPNELERLKKEYKHVETLHSTLKIMEIQYIIEHLFFVLKRNTYYGEAIVKRIDRFIIDLLKSLNLPQEIFSEIWDSLKKHEDLMLYDIDNYRDHLMHQFHVFIVGYLFICSYGVDQFTGLVQKSYCKSINQSSYDSLDNNSVNRFSNLDIIRIWALTSLFHDCGYAFEKLSQGFEAFSERVLGSKLEATFKLDKVFFENSTMIGSVETMASYFACCKNDSRKFDKVKLYRIFTDSLLRKFDHGIISGLILLEKFKKKSNIKNIEDIKNIAAVAISLHNHHTYEKLFEVCNQQICLHNNPFAFLLGYCDTIQEWGRKKKTKNKFDQATPQLENVSFQTPFNGKKVIRKNEVKLKYPSISEGNKPNIEKIGQILSQKKVVFVTPREQLFLVNYDIRDSHFESFLIDFMPCGHECAFM